MSIPLQIASNKAVFAGGDGSGTTLVCQHQNKIVTSDYTVGPLDEIICADASSGVLSITLIAALLKNTVLCIKKIDAVNDVNILSEGLDGETTVTLDSQYQAVTVFSDGAFWWIL